jgi:hypothetical protein
MTPTEAQAHLKSPLKFGNPEQILAVSVMEWVEDVVRAILNCEHGHKEIGTCTNCEGSGDCSCLSCGGEHNCGACGGTGRAERRCSCYAGIEETFLDAALEDPRIPLDVTDKIKELA